MANLKSVNIRLHDCKNELKSIDQQIRSLRERRRDLLEEVTLLESQLSNSNVTQNETNFNADSFPWSKEAQSLLQSVFKLENFRSHQLAAINATLSGFDVLLIMPTGGGKSLCFQLTALISKGLTVVVSPLISLMEDQLNALNELGIPTAILNSNTSREESSRIMTSLANVDSIPFRILYLTPEKLAKSKRIMAQLEKCYANKHFKRFVIDEVHCCSQWGHDFRTDYQFLGIMRNQFPDTPILGLTATATPMVIEDVQKILNIKGCYVFKDSFFRSNLRYSIEKVDDLKKEELIEKIANMIKRRFHGQSGLIYCLTIKDVEDLTANLVKAGVKAMPYHAQLSPESRKKSYYKWFKNDVQVVIATVAFGMGINKNNVRFVVHYSMSKSFENYYQETGRAGRDGQPAECILYFRFADIFRVTSLVFSERNGLSNVYSMVAYCLNRSTCRKRQISDYFGDSWKKECSDACDNCSQNPAHHEIDVLEDMQTLCNILSHSMNLEKKLTFPKLVDIWLGKGEKKLRPDDLKVCKHSREVAQQIVGLLLVDHHLKEEFHFTPYSTISYVNIGPAWLTRPTQPIRYSLPLGQSGKKRSITDKSTGKGATAKSNKHKRLADEGADDDDDIIILS